MQLKPCVMVYEGKTKEEMSHHWNQKTVQQ